MDEQRRNMPAGSRDGDRPAGAEHSEGHAESGGPITGHQQVEDAGQATEIRGQHPVQPAEGPREPGYEENDRPGC